MNKYTDYIEALERDLAAMTERAEKAETDNAALVSSLLAGQQIAISDLLTHGQAGAAMLAKMADAEKRLAMTGVHVEHLVKLITEGDARERALLKRVERLETLLRRYRRETPLGHQPHMIAHEVDEALDTPEAP